MPIHRKNVRPGFPAENAGRGLFLQEIFRHLGGDLLACLGDFLLHNAVVGAEHQQSLFPDIHLGAALDPGHLDYRFFQLSETS